MGLQCIPQVFLDCTDMVDYNAALLNRNDLAHSYFCLDQNDPTIGFEYNAAEAFGPTYPITTDAVSARDAPLHQRLVLGSHLARYLRHELENERGYTATVGVSTNKLLSKLVGTVHKPNSQTTLTPPYEPNPNSESNVTNFMDAHDIGKVPGLGFKLSQKIRARILGRQPAFEDSLVYGATREGVTVKDARTFPGMGPGMLEDVLGGPGSQKGIGGKIWGLLHGVDDTEVGQAKRIPSQISIEDSYVHLDTFEEVKRELTLLSTSLIKRMHLDLMEDDEKEPEALEQGSARRKWLAHPRTFRLSTRPRPAHNPDGSRPRSFNRISRSIPMPTFAFSLTDNIHALAERLVQETLIPVFKKLHPERSTWNLSLVNVAVTNMAEAAADTKDSKGRDISVMFRKQDDVLKEWRVSDVDVAPDLHQNENGLAGDETATGAAVPTKHEVSWESDDEVKDVMHMCDRCGVSVPDFALVAHERFHDMPD
jgi:DNA polymerase iota